MSQADSGGAVAAGAGAGAKSGAGGQNGGSAGVAASGGSAGTGGATAGGAGSSASGWTCAAARYGDGKECDCGCGRFDPDCGDESADSRDVSHALGSCASGPCPSNIAPDDNRLCAVPAGWLCGSLHYGDGFCDCDCGCAVLDADCASRKGDACVSCPLLGCAQNQCATVDPDDNTLCTSAPRHWKCDPRFYRDGTRCDCGCGFPDPDCSANELGALRLLRRGRLVLGPAVPGPHRSGRHHGVRSARPARRMALRRRPRRHGLLVRLRLRRAGSGLPLERALKLRVLRLQLGSLSGLGRSGRHLAMRASTLTLASCTSCGCGALCPDALDPNDVTRCLPPPPEWACSADAWNDFACDCGCGIPDPTCGDPTALYCSHCGGCSGGDCARIDPDDNTACISLPAEWTCDAELYFDAVCDCGCGALDRGCASAQKSDCDFCHAAGSCSTLGCLNGQSPIKTDDNAHCE